MNVLIAIPVFNEEKYLARVLSQVLTYNPRVLVVDDGSTDATPAILRQMPQIQRHAKHHQADQLLKHIRPATGPRHKAKQSGIACQN